MDQVQIRLETAQKNKANIPVAPFDTTICKELFISEMIEGTAMNKALEIFNPTDVPVDLSNFAIRIFHNGQLTPIQVPLSGTIAPKSTHVIAHPAANNDIKARAHEFDTKINFDGNDAIVLEKGGGGNYIDKIGEIGVNPGTAGWTCTSGSTRDHTLRRKGNIGEGEMDWQNKCRNQWDDHPKDNSANLKQHQGVCAAAANDLTFSFSNVIETGSLPNKFLEFDVMIEANNSDTYFDNCLLRIAYNTAVFGTDIVANGGVIITKAFAYDDVSYIDPDANAIDQTTSVMGVPFGTDFGVGSWNRTLVTPFATEMLHFKMAIQTCNLSAGIDFTDITFTPIFSFYTDNATDDITVGISYDNTFYLTGISVSLCVSNITTFTSPVFPGTYVRGSTNTDHLLTITGTNFGVTQGFGNVFFHDANLPLIANPYFPLDKFDFISWTNTQIQIRMPSRMDSVPYQGKTPGSGLFYVKTNLGDSVFSSTEIYMPYSINQERFGSPIEAKIRYSMAGPLDSGAYEFRVDTSISNNPDAYAVLDKAVREWSCLTTVRWSLGASISLQAQTLDGSSVIYFDGSTTTLGNALLQQGACTNSSGDTIVYPVEIDIYFARNLGGGFTWFYDTLENDLPAAKHDFFAVAQHELGHGHVLRHVNQTDDLMYFQLSSGPTAGVNRKEAVKSISGIDGGQEIMVSSSSIVLGAGCTSINLMFPSSGENCLSVGINDKSAKEDLQVINTYPNPLGSDVLNITYDLRTRANVSFRIIDYTGKQITVIDKGTLPVGKYRESIDAGQLTSGFYFLIVNVGEKLYTKKVIKL